MSQELFDKQPVHLHVMSLPRLVFGVAFGVILSHILIAAVAAAAYLIITAANAPARKAEAERRLEQMREMIAETERSLKEADNR